jgi:hypothetical protein
MATKVFCDICGKEVGKDFTAVFKERTWKMAGEEYYKISVKVECKEPSSGILPDVCQGCFLTGLKSVFWGEDE